MTTTPASDHPVTVNDPDNAMEALSAGGDKQAQHRQAIVAFGRRANTGPPLSVLMEDAVWLLVQGLGADRGGTGEVVDEGSTLALRVASVGKRGKRNQGAENRSPTGGAGSMAAFALEAGYPIVTADLAAETRFRDVFLQGQGIVAALTLPLYLNCRPFGALGVYGTQSRQFEPDEVNFAETIAHILTSSIARAKAEEDLSEERSVKSSVLEMVDTMVMMLDREGNVVNMNRLAQELTGFGDAEARGRPFWDVFGDPRELDLIHEVFRGLRRGGAPSEFEGHVVAKDGDKRPVSWSLKVVSNGQVQSILLTGVDQTQQVQAEEAMRKAKHLAERAARALKEHRRRLEKEDDDGPPRSERKPADPQPTEDDQGADRAGALSACWSDGTPRVERRASVRSDYRYPQMLAPLIDEKLPSGNDFFMVECKDISAGGIAFYTDKPPEFDNVVVILGRPPAVKQFIARKVNVAEVERYGRRQYCVGCRFVGRVKGRRARQNPPSADVAGPPSPAASGERPG